MTFSKRLRLYLIGFFIGLLFILFIFGNKVFTWSYLPNDRVLAEIKTKPLKFSDQSIHSLKFRKLSPNFIKNTVLSKGNINFKKSNAQAIPCPYYVLNYEDIEVKFTKCKDTVVINSIN
ncbi:MAG: hypothetical protein J6581_07790 [Apibacter sp.]|jgi:hypothetical protein|nr:hypothetical protein [Apibacter sp.]